MTERVTKLRFKVMADDNFQSFAGVFSAWIEEAREAQFDNLRLLRLQEALAAETLHTQRQRAEFRSQAAETADGEAKQQLELQVAKCDRVIMMLRDVGDGIAWRALGFDRGLLQELGAKAHTGGLELDSIAGEFAHAERYAKETGALVVLNDLTNCLRYGDYTAVSEDEVFVDEVKASRAKSSSKTRQRRSLRKKVESLNLGVATALPGQFAELRTVRVLAETHSESIADLINRSRETGHEGARLSDCFAAEALRADVSLERDPNWAGVVRTMDPFRGSIESITVSTMGRFDRWLRSAAPMSVYPFSAQDCAELMVGKVVVATHLSLHRLGRAFKRAGFNFDLPDDESWRAFDELSPDEKRNNEVDLIPIRISRNDSPYLLSIPPSQLSRMTYEFLTADKFVEYAAELVQAGGQPRYLSANSFINEDELWL